MWLFCGRPDEIVVCLRILSREVKCSEISCGFDLVGGEDSNEE